MASPNSSYGSIIVIERMGKHTMAKAYDKMYLEDASDNLGFMLGYAESFGFDPVEVWKKFIVSKVASKIEKGDVCFISGHSALDYLLFVFENDKDRYERLSKAISQDNKKELDDVCYWAGFSLAQFQYESGLSFSEIDHYLPIQDVLNLFYPLHEADVTKFFDVANSRIDQKKKSGC